MGWWACRLLNDCTDGNYGSDYSTCVDLNPDGTGKAAPINYRDTVIYNAFVWAQVFNEVNARKIYNEKNMSAPRLLLLRRNEWASGRVEGGG